MYTAPRAPMERGPSRPLWDFAWCSPLISFLPFPVPLPQTLTKFSWKHLPLKSHFHANPHLRVFSRGTQARIVANKICTIIQISAFHDKSVDPATLRRFSLGNKWLELSRDDLIQTEDVFSSFPQSTTPLLPSNWPFTIHIPCLVPTGF